MAFVDKIIKGEDKFIAFMDKFDPSWRDYKRIENCWRLGRVHVERFYEMGPGDDHYKEFFWLTMDSDKPGVGYTDYSGRRREIYEGIRTGRITG